MDSPLQTPELRNPRPGEFHAASGCPNFELEPRANSRESSGLVGVGGGHKGMGSHQSARMDKDEWLTPPEILAATGPFDLDVCAPIVRPWEMASRHYTCKDNGLLLPWDGRVWCNPPYGRDTGRWLARCAEHANATALIFARTETADWVEHVWKKAHAILFIWGRLYFHHVDGRRAAANAGAPSALIAYDAANAAKLQFSGIAGQLVTL